LVSWREWMPIQLSRITIVDFSIINEMQRSRT
jgi:hypothetical protein